MSVSYEYYKIFYYVARYGSFTRAARVLGNSQPNITRAMNNLEYELDCRLFVRSHRGVRLTEEGEILFNRVKAAQEHLERAESELAAARNLQKGLVTIAASETAIHLVLFRVIQRFNELYPGVQIKLLNCSTPQAIHQLHEETADLAIVTTPVQTGSEILTENVLVSRDILAAGARFAELKGKTLSLQDVSGYPMVCLGPNTSTYELYNQFFAREGIVMETDVEAATADLLAPMIEHGLGLGFVAEVFAGPKLRDGSLFEVKIDRPLPERFLCMMQLRDRKLSHAAESFRDTVLEECRRQK